MGEIQEKDGGTLPTIDGSLLDVSQKDWYL